MRCLCVNFNALMPSRSKYHRYELHDDDDYKFVAHSNTQMLTMLNERLFALRIHKRRGKIFRKILDACRHSLYKKIIKRIFFHKVFIIALVSLFFYSCKSSKRMLEEGKVRLEFSIEKKDRERELKTEDEQHLQMLWHSKLNYEFHSFNKMRPHEK